MPVHDATSTTAFATARAELGDWVANMAGVLGAALTHWLVRRFMSESVAHADEVDG